MLIVMHHNATEEDVQRVKETIERLGYRPVAIPGAERTAIGVIGNQGWVDDTPFQELAGIREIIHVTKPYKLVSRDFHPEDTVVSPAEDVTIGSKEYFAIIAGPCAVESTEQMLKVAKALRGLGVRLLRGGAFKPRTSPHSFQGLREEGLRILKEVKDETGMLVVTEVMSPEHVEKVSEVADILQIGARNMQNYDLLIEVGRAGRPVLLKRGLAATVEEWLSSAEYILIQGNPEVIMCERGIRTYERATRNTADLSVIPLIKELSHLPVIFDPSHATGRRSLVRPMALASVMAGAHGVMVEVHPEPDRALSDAAQSLDIEEFSSLYKDLVALFDFKRKGSL
ncbi:MAG: 3-deoxy-7-phosphoheptulonate synthase [Nitrospirae bacterium]|nr:MAG: 3-deoxy-7-phosphoheptulonate synthase [Nitrospirota bacterium]